MVQYASIKKSLTSLNKTQKKAFRKHAKHHTKKHVKSMVASLKKGKTFTQAHNSAMRKVGK
mgnify:CR=1 FL=1